MLFTTEEHTFFKGEQKSWKNQQEIKKSGNYLGIIDTILFIFTADCRPIQLPTTAPPGDYSPPHQRRPLAADCNLTGFANAIEAVFPKTEIQNCIIHQLRISSKYVSYKDLKALMADLKAVYAAIDEQTALEALEVFSKR